MTHAEAFFAALFPTPEERALVRGLLEGPDDRARRLVYADWLEEHGGADRARSEFLRTGRDDLRLPAGAEWLSAIGDTAAGFRDLRERVAREWAEHGYEDSLRVESDHGLLDVRYEGSLSGELLGELRERLVGHLVAPVLRSLRFDACPERGFAN